MLVPDNRETEMIDMLRDASRRLVRELGFMGGAIAGTDLSPSAVHALIEVESGPLTARDLATLLRLDKSSVSRLLRKLIDRNLLTETAGEKDARTKCLYLTAQGRDQVAAIHAYARAQVTGALTKLHSTQAATVLDGISLYAAALDGAVSPAPSYEIVTGYQSGLIGRITQMHADHYARTVGFGAVFESRVAGGLADFVPRLDNPRNAIWTVRHGKELFGSIAIDGEDLGDGSAHLRWFILDDSLRGAGLGRALLGRALAFVDAAGFTQTQLFTVSGLSAARHLYEAHGFALAEEQAGGQWGKEVIEQRFVRTG